MAKESSKSCPECGVALPPGAPRGLCPACLIRLGLDAPRLRPVGNGDTASPAPDSARQPPEPEQIGPYRILERIGEGGMGSVYLAEQHAPIRRRVAVKIIKLGMDTRQVIARFESERQALVLMDHPNIAGVLDAGEHEGRPYFVMEYVAGVPITEYCDRHRLGLRERLDLFTAVCRAIQHAHQKGIIHRDIKPSNVLVTFQDGAAVPKVIDFGVAKAASQSLTEKTLFTQHGLLIGTPEYMSPEQADATGLEVDTRTDIYSLGILLYELLTGVLPFDPKALREAGFEEIRRIIREDDPAKPTTQLERLGAAAESIAKHRHTDLKSLGKCLRGDLEWITLKALEKERARRYPSASAFAADIERHLRHDPVEAGPPSRAYRIGKFARKHRVPVAAAAAICVTVLVLGGVSIAFGIDAVRSERATIAARNAAETEAAIANAVQLFLAEDLLQMADPVAQLGRQQPGVPAPPVTATAPDITVLQLLDRAAAGIGDRFVDRPLVEATIRETIGGTYAGLGRYYEARAQLERALEIRLRAEGALKSPESFETAVLLGHAHLRTFNHPSAGRLAKEVIVALGHGPGFDDAIAPAAITLFVLVYGNSLYIDRSAELPAATAFLRDLIDELRDSLGDEHATTGVAISGMVALFRNQLSPRFADAEAFLLSLFQEQRRRLGDAHAAPLSTARQLLNLYRLQSPPRSEAAEAFLDALPADQRAALRGDDPEASPVALPGPDATPGPRPVSGSEATATARRLTAVAGIVSQLTTENRIDEAEREVRVLLEEFRGIGASAPDALPMASTLATLVTNTFTGPDRARRGLALAIESLQVTEEKFGQEHPATAEMMVSTATMHFHSRNDDQAESLLKSAIDQMARQLGPGHRARRNAMFHLTRVYDRQYRALMAGGRPDEARQIAAACAALYSEWLALPDASGAAVRAMMDGVRGVAYALAGDYALAESTFRQQMEGLRYTLTQAEFLLPAQIAYVGWTEFLRGDYTEAELTLRDALREAERSQRAGPNYFRILEMLGAILTGQGRFEEAEEYLLQAYDGHLGYSGEAANTADWLGFHLVRFISEEIPGERLLALYEAWRRDDKVGEWRDRVASTPPTFDPL